ncbi:aminopeptidase [Vibrio cholerae]|uniref:DUF3630 family protein n=1 Tax=Vibrio cholerae TaxID=666 RepID=UPI001E43D406|nr:DUF3630 family protein [Vibrio cholerae]MCD1222219.1 aminopeptidase [Vibrio cholerae]MCD1251638.1 aminopeptidase [Vibrio cholerae]
MAEFGLSEYLAAEGRLIVHAENFDFEAFAETALRLVNLLSARVLEKQCDADLHTWLIDFEGCHLLLRGEHYSQSLWLETLTAGQGDEELAFIAKLLAPTCNAK